MLQFQRIDALAVVSAAATQVRVGTVILSTRSSPISSTPLSSDQSKIYGVSKKIGVVKNSIIGLSPLQPFGLAVLKLWLDGIHPHLSTLLTALRDSHKKLLPFGDEQPGSRTRCGRKFVRLLILIRIDLGKDGDKAFAPD